MNMIKRIDWHTHILPQIDDGSSSVEESLAMLKTLAKSGVEAVALTPHFYPDRSYPDAFLKARNESYKRLQSALTQETPELLLGAEVTYFDGIKTCDDMRSLVIDQTNCLLIEMPVYPWNDRMFENILYLAESIKITPVLAHIDRYVLRKCDRELIDVFIAEGGLVQVSSSFFLKRHTERKAFKMLEGGAIHLIGSDCHNMTKRLPTTGEAFDVIDQRASASAIEGMNNIAKTILQK